MKEPKMKNRVPSLAIRRVLPAALLSVACAFALAVPEDANASSKKKKQPGDSGVEELLRFKAGDENGNEVKALKTEVLVMKSEQKALDQLERLERRYKGTRMEPEILFRLAELYMRRARTDRFFEIHRNSEQVYMFAPSLVNEASEAGKIKKAIAIYDRIQEAFPRFRSMDVVIFNNAYARQQIGDDKGAERLLLSLINDYPKSNLVPDSYLSVGEINFKARQYSKALDYFKALKKFPESRVYPYGLYKAAWSYYNLQDAAAGMKQLEEVVAFGRKVAQEKLDSKLDLRKEALGDLALFYGDVKTSGEAVDYFKDQAQELDASPYIMKVVALYKRHSRYQDVELILKDILVKLPESEAIASAHEELVWNYERTKQQANAVNALEGFDQYCTSQVQKRMATPEMKKKISAGEVIERAECQVKISDTSKKLATKWHALWKKFGGNEYAPASEKAYRLYLKSADTKDQEIATIHFALSELLFAQGKFREASDNYAVIEKYQKDGTKVDEKVAQDAAYGALVSLEKAVADKYNDQDEKRFVELSESYIRRFPKGEFVLELQFKRAFIAYEKERYDEAAPLLKKIGWMKLPDGSKSADKVAKAQDLYLDILNVKKDYKGLKEAAAGLLSLGATDTRKTQFEKIYREAYFAEIQGLEENGDLLGAIEAYKKFALENQASDLGAKAWWNASQLQFRVGDATGGANTCYQMYKLFPKSSNGRDCLTKAAQTFETMGRLDLAARVLLNLAQVEGEDAAKWRQVAADFFALSGDKERAITMYQKLAEGRKAAQQLPILEKAALLARETGDMKILEQIESQYSQMGIEPQASRLVVEQAEEALTKGDLTKAFNLSKKIIARDSLPKELLARARFVQASVLDDEYKKQSIKARVDRVGMVLAIKTEKLEKAQKAYQSTIRYGDPEMSVKAFRRLAEIYMDYSRAVRAIELKGSVSEADLKAFRSELEQLSVPMEEKGIEAMAQALEAAKKAQLRGGQIAELQEEVDRLNMKKNTAPAVVVTAPNVYVPEFRVFANANKGVGL